MRTELKGTSLIILLMSSVGIMMKQCSILFVTVQWREIYGRALILAWFRLNFSSKIFMIGWILICRIRFVTRMGFLGPFALPLVAIYCGGSVIVIFLKECNQIYRNSSIESFGMLEIITWHKRFWLLQNQKLQISS